MNQLQTFNHDVFGELPVLIASGSEWFGATEAAKALSFSDPYDAIRNHVDEEDSALYPVLTRGGKQQKKFINESGLYSLIFGAAKQGNNPVIREKAQKFKRWVTAEVLPTIRKTGGYVADDDMFIQTYLPHADEQTKILFRSTLETVRNLNKQIETMKPKVLFADSVSASETSILIRDLAKLITQNGVPIGEKRLFAWMRENGFLIKKQGSDYNSPTQRAMEMGLFEIKESTINRSSGIQITKTPKVTGKGQIYFIEKFLGKKSKEVV